MIDIINIAAALLTIAFGAFGFIAPRYTLAVLDLAPTNTNMGLSEARASVGGLFVSLGIIGLLVGNPMFYVAMGAAYAGAATGRLVSLAFDAPPTGKLMLYFGIEASLAAWLILANIGSI